MTDTWNTSLESSADPGEVTALLVAWHKATRPRSTRVDARADVAIE